ncbi:unnamed protein product [Rotaria sp. Silwood2]|nr:unnamed protein product [Rotaria sp. Silwood2]
MRHLRQLLTENVVIKPMLPVDTILKVIQSDDIPSDVWLDCLLAAAQSDTNNSSNENAISFDFSPVIMPTIDLDLQRSNSASTAHQVRSKNRNESVIDRSYLDDMNLTHQLLSSVPSSRTQKTPISYAAKEEPLDVYQVILRENLTELSQVKWDRSAILSLESKFMSAEISNNVSSLKTALLVIETIVTNRISLRTHIERVVNTITMRSVREWMNELNKIVDEQGKAKSVSVLLEELARENPSLNITKLEQRYQKVMHYYETQASKLTSVNIRQQSIFDDELKTIAIIIQAARLHKQYRPRDIQILSLLLLIENPRQGRGRLAQIRTGEGKSIIVSMLAVYLSLPPLSKRVDIITTSEILAQRDADEFAPLYQMFHLSVGHNCSDPSTKPNYNVHIVYGTVSHFAGDLLRTDFYLQTEIRGNRPYEAAIVDEVDSMFIDQRQHYTQLASLTPGYKSLNVILRFIYSFFQKFNITEDNEFVIRQTNGYYKGEKIFSCSAQKVEFRIILLLVDVVQFIRRKMAEKELVRFSAYRQEYIDAKLPKWIRSARQALYGLTVNVDYVISKDGRIVVVDYANTGVSQMNMHWSDGMHQFLELKHNLRMTPERMCDSFFSNVTLFKRYQPHLYGVTGTLGGKDARNFIRSVYDIDAFDVPKYIDSVFDTYPNCFSIGQFSRSREKWLENIRIECRTIAITNRRAVLIICETIREAEDIQLALRSQHPRLKSYLRSDLAEHIKPEEVFPNDVIVATNLAGRGTDLKTMTVVNDQGGLHVIVTFMPRNSRIEQQAFGRAGRQGQPGSARLIVFDECLGLKLEGKVDEPIIINSWKIARDECEERDMAEAVKEVERIETKDRLLVRFLDLAHSQKNKLPFANDMFKPGFSSLRELWASFCDLDETTAEQRYPHFESNIRQQINESIAILESYSSEGAKDLINIQFQAVSHLIVHPKYFIYAGFHALCTDGLNDKKGQALKLYKCALQIDSQDFIAHYNTVPCHIENKQISIKQAIQALDEAIRLLNIEIEIRKMLEIFHDPPTPDDGETKTNGPIDQTSLAELVYLQIVHSTFEDSRKQLREFDEEKHDISCEFKHWPETLDCLKGTKFEPLTNDINAEREEWLGEGLMWRYVFVIQVKRCWWKTVFVFVMGVAQIVGGAYLCLKGQFRLGTSLIIDGALDVYKAVATRITADFDLTGYFEAKVIKYGKLLLGTGGPLSGVLEPIISLEKIKMVGVAIDAVRQIDKNGFTMENLTQLALSGMTLAGVDQKAIDFVKKLPERIKDAEALLSGDINKMLERGASAGLPVKTIQQIVKNGFSIETATQLAVDGMAIAGVDQKAINVVKQLPERIKDAQALVSGDINKILERGMLAGLPVKTIQQIAKNGFSVETVAQLAVDGMAFQGVDQKTIDLVKQLPERMKDAEALLSGDINKILERGKLAGLPVNAIQQIAKNGFSVDTAAQLAVDGMAIAGVDQNAIDFVKKLPERIQDVLAMANGDITKMLKYAETAGLPVHAIRQIATNGFSAETVTQLALEGMTLAGVDPTKVNFVKKLPEQIKDAQALLSGNIDEISKRGMLAGIPVNTVRQIYRRGISLETATQLTIDGINITGMDPKAIDFVKQLPERMKDAKALLSGDINAMLERGMSAGLPLNAVHQIAKRGFSAETATQLALEGMSLVGVDPNRIDFVKKLPEQIKDAQALITGDIDAILKRDTFAGIPINAIRQIATQENSVKAIKHIAFDGMAIAGVDKNTLNFVKKLPEGIKDIETLFNGDLEKMLRQNMSGSIDQLLGMFTEQSLFSGKEKEMFQIIRRRIPMIQDVVNGDGKAVLSNALQTFGQQINNLPLTDFFDIALPTAIQRVANREQEAIRDVFKSTVDQLKSISGDFNEQTCQVINQILQSSDKWDTFEKTKNQLDNNVRRLLGPAIEREKEFMNAYNSLTSNPQAIHSYRQALSMKFGMTRGRGVDLQKLIERNADSGGFLLKRAVSEFFNEVSCQESGTKSPEVMKLLKEHFNESFIRPIAEKTCERQMDQNDTELVNNFTNAITYVQKQRQQTQH